MQKIPVVIVGANGYSGEELVRLLLRHPGVELRAVTSRSEAGKALTEVMPRFRGWPGADGIRFIGSEAAGIAATGAQVAFLALPHGLAAEFAGPLLAAGLRVVDLSADFRLRDAAVYEEFYGHAHPAPELLGEAVYGMPELHRARIGQARLVASPGCYPTSIILPLVPLLRRGLVDPESLIANSLSGTSGAGRKADVSLLFAECNESVQAYGVPKHRHLSEIEQELGAAAGRPLCLSFTPHLLPVTRGILTTLYATPAAGVDFSQIGEALRTDWGAEPFVRLLGERGALPRLADVVGTNFLDLAWRFDPRTRRVLLFSAEDNLVKGAAGQAVQAFNLLTGQTETTGLL
ncbi:MAG: N-acetyl-gamma-glutamyl-phosphate reductase [Verrucomicrobia bacterium]|nr:N-acetyl-gamma-glutamyl-phosphate reductase [Verrucomicrobiota bacterium]